MALHATTQPLQAEHSVLRKRLMDQAGLLHEVKNYDLAKLAEIQWSDYFWYETQRLFMSVLRRFEKVERLDQFERYMRNRLLMGAFRYGTFLEQRGQGLRHDNIPSALRRLRKYWASAEGNQELLVDAANLCLVEFVAPGSHPSPVDALEAANPPAQRPQEAQERLRAYREQGDQNRLREAAAYCALEFCFPQHQHPVWDPIDDGEHVSTARKT